MMSFINAMQRHEIREAAKKAPVAIAPVAEESVVPAAEAPAVTAPAAEVPAVTEPTAPAAEAPAVTEPTAPAAEAPTVTEPTAPVAEAPTVTEPTAPAAEAPAVTEPTAPAAEVPQAEVSAVAKLAQAVFATQIESAQQSALINFLCAVKTDPSACTNTATAQQAELCLRSLANVSEDQPDLDTSLLDSAYNSVFAEESVCAPAVSAE